MHMSNLIDGCDVEIVVHVSKVYDLINGYFMLVYWYSYNNWYK